MLILSYLLLTAHFMLLGVLCLFGLHRLSIVIRWLKYRHYVKTGAENFAELPSVTVQIPLFNERFVAERAIHAVAALDYPSDRLQIQIVDDSTDETRALVSGLVSDYAAQGVNIVQVHRTNREGFKAGALREAMASATGEFIAIFDADFVPAPATLMDTIHYFAEPELAMLQFRWEHLNRNDTLLTQCQAMMLDSHFALEQQVRHASGALFNFNGTAGIWRAQAILDAGNWSADTLTEDLDLSYRAQLAGWQMRYVNGLTSPGELPANMNAFKSQQHRWAKGGLQVMKKLLPRVWRSNLPVRHKLEASFHLSNNMAYFIMLLDTTLFLLPSLLIRDHLQLETIFWLDLPLLLISTGGHLVYFYFGQVALNRSRSRALILMPRLLLVGIQLAFNNAKAAIEALAGHQSEFVRTPKAGDVSTGSSIKTGDDAAVEEALVNTSKPSLITGKLYRAITPRGGWFELLLGTIYLLVLFWGAAHQHWFMLPFIALLVIGFYSTAIGTLKEQYRLGAN